MSQPESPNTPERRGDGEARREDEQRQEDVAAVQSARELIIGELLEDGASDPQRMARVARYMEMHAGPMPDPQTLREYKEIDPRLVDEVIEGARENRKHRMRMDLRLSGTARISLYGTWSVVMLLIIAAIGFAAAGLYWPAGLFGAAGVAPVLKYMILGGGTWTGRGDRGKKDDSAEE